MQENGNNDVAVSRDSSHFTENFEARGVERAMDAGV